MSATAPTTVNNNAIVTRLRKRRDLETTMTTLKQLLEPTIKKGSRKKNKPRSLAKKVVPPKPANRYENTKDDGEYYPNKLKRKMRLKKTVLRPKHELKVVVATNKRKRCTPHKGLDFSEELTDYRQGKPSANSNLTYTNLTNLNETSNASVHTNVQLASNNPSVHTSTLSTSNLHIQTSSSNSNVQTSNKTQSYKLISPPHRSLTQLTVDDLIRMDEDSLSDEDMMEILTCPSPVWWEDPADTAEGNVFLTKTSELSTPVVENTEETTREGVGFKRSSVTVSASKARKIAKLENILGHIKSLVSADVRLKSPENNEYNNKIIKKDDNYNNDCDNDVDAVLKADEKKAAVIIEAKSDITTPEVNDIDRKRGNISSSSSEISVNEDELLRNLENINIPIEEQKESQKINDEDDIIYKNSNDVPIDDIEEIDRNDEEKEPVNETGTKQNKTKRQKRLLKKKIESPVSNQSKGKQLRKRNDSNKKHVKNKETEINKPSVDNKKNLEKLDGKNDDILDVRLIKVPTNVTNEVKVWSTLENFKRHNFKPSDFESNEIDIGEEYEIPISRKIIKEKDPLELNNETILIDDDSNDIDVNSGIDIVNVNEHRTHVTITPTTDDTSCNSEVIDINSIPKDTIVESDKIEEASDNTNEERSIIKEDTIRIGHDLDVRLIETSDAQNKTKQTPDLKELNNVTVSIGKVVIPKIIEKEGTEVVSKTHALCVIAKLEAKSEWHVNKYLKFDKTNDRGIFRVDDHDDSSDTILCLNDVDVSLVKNPRLHNDKANTVKVDESINDLSITLVSKSDVKGVTITPMVVPKLTKHPITESPKSIKSTSDSIENDTISDTNVQFLDEYEDDKTVHREEITIQTVDKIDSEQNTAKEKETSLVHEDIEFECSNEDNIEVSRGDESTDYEDENEDVSEIA